ncbi:MAG: hypothetical protein HQL51_02240 [Magnetococcales bacterium]|nr:hypothetical protein [Magnetococcales bacterium]
MGWGGDAAASAAEATYRRFVDAFVMGRFDEARELALEPVQRIVGRKEQVRRQGEIPPEHGETMIVSTTPQAGAGAEAEAVKIHGVQVLQFSPKADGTESAPSFHRQFVTLVRRGEGWRVSEFRDEQEACCD